MVDAHDILKQYWGYQRFRPKQLEIIQSIAGGVDTLALLPTGGGKSICFQVPALMLPGVCLVISPLMALMHDQVNNLRKRNISAYAVTSAMRYREMDRVLDNCIYGSVKFLYVSPERLRNELFIERFKKMNIAMIAVDEAHCISQWGYDFRPSYLQITELRQLKPHVPVLALTASATPRVVEDIQHHLGFKQNHVLGTGFGRPNLSYNVLYSEGKDARIVDICGKMKGTGIVYCGTRLRTKELMSLLLHKGIAADAYHAGMTIEERNRSFQRWMSGQVRIICATNAFGMGIDKPDVRFVLHADVPANLESYFQEAGRAGRDGQLAHAVLLYHKGDIEKLQRQVEQKFPSKEFIRKVYKCIAMYLQYAPGAGKDTSNEFDLADFTKKFQLPFTETVFAIQLLELAEYLTLSESVLQTSQVIFEVNRNELYNYQVVNQSMDDFIKVLLRTYTGMFEQYTSIREEELARNSKMSVQRVTEKLVQLAKQGIIDYQPPSAHARLTLLTGRMDESSIRLPEVTYEFRKKNEEERLYAISKYLEKKQCRSIQLLNYFGEPNTPPCNQCDVCRESQKNGFQPQDFEKMQQRVMQLAVSGNYTIDDYVKKLSEFSSAPLIDFIRWKLNNGELTLNNKMEIVVP